jgi:hypothetical protein
MEVQQLELDLWQSLEKASRFPETNDKDGKGIGGLASLSRGQQPATSPSFWVQSAHKPQ